MLNGEIRAVAPYGRDLTKLDVKLTPEQSSTPSLYAETNSVYLSRPTEGTGELMELVGGTVAWNQLFKAAGASTINGITFSRSADLTTQTMDGTATANVYRSLPDIPSTIVNHIYYVSQEYAITGVQIYNDSAGVSTQGNKETIGKATAVKGWFIRVSSGTALDNVSIRPLIIDLTAMLPSGIADYVYSLEQSQAGSGIAWLKKYDLIDDNYHAYSQSSLESVNVSAHVMRDANNNIIETYPIDSSVTLRGMLKTDADGNLYYDGDTYEWDGTVTRKWEEVTFDGSSDESWNVAVSGGHYRGYITISDIKPFDGSFSSISMLYKCSSFVNGTWDNVFGGNAVAGMTGQNWGFGLDALSITDSAGLKTWLSSHPIELIYVLATPTTESADPFTAVQTVEDGGTEEFVTTNGVPVGVVGRFANVAPISGRSLVNIYTGDIEGTAEATYTTDLQRLVYGGVFDAINGNVTETMDEIEEYNGETIGEPWLSSLDVYSQGATPTNGAQVIYTKTPTTFLIPPPTITTAKTYWWSDSGEVDWGYAMVGLGLMPVITLADPFE